MVWCAIAVVATRLIAATERENRRFAWGGGRRLRRNAPEPSFPRRMEQDWPDGEAERDGITARFAVFAGTEQLVIIDSMLVERPANGKCQLWVTASVCAGSRPAPWLPATSGQGICARSSASSMGKAAPTFSRVSAAR